MKAIQSIAVVGVGSLVFAIACSGGVDGSCQSYVDKLIAFETQCSGLGAVDSSAKDAFVAQCKQLGTAPGTDNLSGQIDTCTQALDVSACKASTCSVRGTLAVGAACAVGAQCQSGHCNVSGASDPTTELRCGTCAALAAQGADCTDASCDTGLYCDATKKCTPYVSQGGSCANGEQCDSGLRCDVQSMTCTQPPTKGQACSFACAAPYACVGGTCADAVAEGGACPTGAECQTSLTCDAQTHVCKKPAVAKAGEACGFVNNQYLQCDSGLQCGPDGVCVAPKPQGASCTVGKDECTSNLDCVGGTCQVPDYSTCK